MKSSIGAWLMKKGYEVHDLGALAKKADDDYPQYAFAVGEEVAADAGSFGVLICKSGAGMAIAANKVPGIRAVECLSVKAAKHAREHNNANVLVLSGDWLSKDVAEDVTKAFLATQPSAEKRHRRRIAQITTYERS